MAKFYFHLKADGELVTDDEGVDLPSMTDATRLALESARELLANAIKFGNAKVPEAFVVADETGQALFELPLVEVLPGPLKCQFPAR
jgi:hypothetical protein